MDKCVIEIRTFSVEKAQEAIERVAGYDGKMDISAEVIYRDGNRVLFSCEYGGTGTRYDVGAWLDRRLGDGDKQKGSIATSWRTIS